MFGWLMVVLAVGVGAGIANAEDRSPLVWGAGTALAVFVASSWFGLMGGAALGLAAVIVAATVANYRRKL